VAVIFANFPTDKERVDVINHRVIPRMREIDLCGKVSKYMQDNNCFDGTKSFSSASFKLTDEEFYSSIHSRQLTDPVLDTGITMVRAMLQFFHVGIHKDGHMQPYKGHHDGNIVIQSFQIEKPIRNPDAINFLFKCLTPSEIESIRVTAMNGNKGVAHLTIHKTASIPLNQLSDACFAMNKLLNYWLVNPILGKSAEL